MGIPRLTVIVPAHRAAHLLPETLGALRGSDLPRAEWELIVVDDASGDDTAAVAAREADRVVALEGRPRGPGGARNAGAAHARGDWLLFVDADVRVHRDTLRRVVEAIRREGDAVALFGAYDARPAAGGLISQYRNLLHRHVHLAGAGAAETFWAGLGAVRRDWFVELGGFDTARFPRPQIEDIELGYRIRDRGGRIVLDPAIQGTHLKRWTLGAMVRTDIRDRGLPWMRLLLERRGGTRASLNIGWRERAKVGIAAVALASLVPAVLLREGWPLLLMLGLIGLLVVVSFPTYRWFAAERGGGFALAVVPLHLLYYAGSAVAAVGGVLLYALGRGRFSLRKAGP